MSDPGRLRRKDRVTRLIERAEDLLDGSADQTSVTELLADLERLPPRELVRFDWQSRSWSSGLTSDAIAHLRWPRLSAVRRPLWEALGLVSGDGYERERAINAATLTPLIVRLVVIRCIDWVGPVRGAALDRLDGCPHNLLVTALPLAEQLVGETSRGHLLGALLDARLSDEDLRGAYRSEDPRVRRAAWTRLAIRGSTTPDELRHVAAADNDVMVRAVAAGSLARLPPDARRSLAAVLIDDRVGWIAARALTALIELEGTDPIIRALTARRAALRRAARGWAAIRDIDARGVYLQRLARQSGDALSFIALAEISDQRDAHLIRSLLDDPRPRVRAAALRALGRIDRGAARREAIAVLQSGASGRLTRAAADVLRGGVPNAGEIAALSSIALDDTRPAGQRLRVITLLRPARWAHLAVLLEAREAAADPVRHRLDSEVCVWISGSRRISRGPEPDTRSRIERLLHAIDPGSRREIEFVLRTSI